MIENCSVGEGNVMFPFLKIFQKSRYLEQFFWGHFPLFKDGAIIDAVWRTISQENVSAKVTK